MILGIAKHEFKSIYRDGRFRLAAILLGLLFALSVFGAYDYHLTLKKEHDEASHIMREQWENQQEKNPHAAAHYGTYVFKPVYPLSFFDRGLDAYTGNVLFLEGHKSNIPVFRAVEEQPDFARLGNLTPAFVLGILMPLFIIVLGFGAAAAEKENGNLRLLLAQGVKPYQLFLGKCLGLWTAVLLLTLPFFVAGASGLLVSGVDNTHWLRYACIFLFYQAYFGCFIHLTFFISALVGRQQSALVGTLGLWVFCCLILPKAAVSLARQLYPVPSWETYNEAIAEDLKNGVDGHDGTSAFTQKLQQQTLEKYRVESVEQLPFNWAGFVMQRGEEHQTYIYQKHRRQLLDIYQKQEQMKLTAATFSPYILLNALSQRLSGTDVDAFFDFLGAAEKYRVQLVGELNDDLTYNFSYGNWEGKRGSEFFAGNVKFNYLTPSLNDLLYAARMPAGAIFLWLLISGLLAALSFHQLKPF
jgi:ABC-2 type transport system permease protein